MTEAKFYRDFPMILELFSQLKQGVRISILDENQNIICLADYLAEIQDYIINNHLYEKAKELILYKDLLQKVYDYCQTDKAVPEAKQMAKECDFIGCCAVLEVLEQWLNDKGQNDNTERAKTYSKDIELPKELDNDKGKSIIDKAIAKGLCSDKYKWFKSKALLAYFSDRASEYLNLGKGEYDGKAKISWKPFESLFGISGLSGAKRDYQKTGTLPNGHKDVDQLFE